MTESQFYNCLHIVIILGLICIATIKGMTSTCTTRTFGTKAEALIKPGYVFIALGVILTAYSVVELLMIKYFPTLALHPGFTLKPGLNWLYPTGVQKTIFIVTTAAFICFSLATYCFNYKKPIKNWWLTLAETICMTALLSTYLGTTYFRECWEYHYSFPIALGVIVSVATWLNRYKE